jgi:hypothetical protein
MREKPTNRFHKTQPKSCVHEPKHDCQRRIAETEKEEEEK